MPRLEVAIDLEPTAPEERDLCCFVCDLPNCEWKLTLPTKNNVIWRAIHGACKIALESRYRSHAPPFEKEP